MNESSSIFRSRVIALVVRIPVGKVMTYGQIAALCGNPKAARIVGGIAHFGDPELPWHRVVAKNGGLASGFPGGRFAQATMLGSEGVKIDGTFKVANIEKVIWHPNRS